MNARPLATPESFDAWYQRWISFVRPRCEESALRELLRQAYQAGVQAAFRSVARSRS
jgi:hypothetical protein